MLQIPENYEMASSSAQIFASLENNLITFKCEQDSHGWQRVCLMGMAHMKEDLKKEETEGRVLLFSGDPLTHHENGERYRNKLSVEKIPLTDDQKKCVVQFSKSNDNCVYMYAGDFHLGKVLWSVGNCRPRGNLNVLEFLADYMTKSILEFDMSRYVPMTVGQIGKVILPNKDEPEEKPEPKQKIGANGDDENKAKVTFQTVDRQVFVSLECPPYHECYRVDITLYQKIMCKSSVSESCPVRKITKLIGRDSVVIPSYPDDGDSPDDDDDDWFKPELVSLPVKAYKFPREEENKARGMLGKFNVCCVEYWLKTRLSTEPEENVKNKKVGTDNGENKGIGAKSKTKKGKGSKYKRNCGLPVELVMMEVKVMEDEIKADD